MALKPVTDPNLLTALNSAQAPDPATVPGPKAVTDPALLAQLNAPDQPPAEPDPLGANSVPVAPTTAAPTPEEPSIWDKFKSSIADDPIIQMWGHGLTTAAQGAPEVAADMIGNTGVQAVAGLTAPFAPGDSADYIRDFANENSMRPQGESAQALTGGLGDAFAPLGNVKQALGEGAESLGANPDVAATASMLPDFLMSLAGGGAASKAAELPQKALKADPIVNPVVGSLRDADIRLRPSDVRAMTPGAKKVPGEFRERFADAPGLKKDLTLHNQTRLTDIAAKDIGVKALDEASLAKAKEAPAATYDMVESVLSERGMSPELKAARDEALDSIKLELPRGKPPTTVGLLGKLRQRAAKRLQSDNPEMEAKGYADRNMAEALEDEIGRDLKTAGEPQLFKQYQDARQQFAKIHDVESATRAGQIDANVVYKLGQRVKLSGGLKLIADAAENAPNVTGHSLKTAARAGGEIEGSKEGITKGLIKSAIRKIPGVDVGAESFQNTLGLPNEARAASYGRPSDVVPARGPEQGGLDLREALNLNAPPGEVGAPERSLRELGLQVDALGNAFDFDAPPGAVGIPPDAQMNLQELLGLGEPLHMKAPPGRVGKPKRKS